MNSRLLGLICLAGCIVSAGARAQAADSARNRAITTQSPAAEPQRAVPGTPARVRSATPVPVESVARDLQRIVVLCATEPASEAFKAAWASYIEQHRVTAADLDSLIADVVERAEAYRTERASDSRTNRTKIAPTTRTMMHDTAMALIRNMR